MHSILIFFIILKYINHFQNCFFIFYNYFFFLWVFQKLIIGHFIQTNVSYEVTRLITSGSFFIIGYLLHRQFSFKDFKKVGIYFYLNNSLNLNKIFNIIGNNLNFFAWFISDSSFSKSKIKNKISTLIKINSPELNM